MDRREFCHVLGICTLGACVAGPLGCARFIAATAPNKAGAVAPAGSTHPDLAVFHGEDPGRTAYAAVEALGGMGRFVRRGARVVVKPNVCHGTLPELAVCTNPGVVGAIIRMCFDAGARSVTVLDRPTTSSKPAFADSGIARVVAREGARINYLGVDDYHRYSIPEGRLLTSWPLVGEAIEADVLINVPIAKVHGLPGVTLGMKNLMGLMGGYRSVMHKSFEERVCDLYSRVRPDLTVLDAFRMRVRNGPFGTNPADVVLQRTVVAGTDPVAIDTYGAILLGKRPADLPFLNRAAARGLGTMDLSALWIAKGKS